MIKYAKIEKNGTLSVGTGNNEAFYQSIGMTLMDVEKGWDGNYYLAGQVPEKPQKLALEEELSEQEDILSSTDWYAIRFADTGEEIPADVKAKRQAARERIDEIRAQMEEDE